LALRVLVALSDPPRPASLAITGTLMAPLPALAVTGVLAGAMAFCMILDAVKCVAFTHLNRGLSARIILAGGRSRLITMRG
jgi:hypothetical protein